MQDSQSLVVTGIKELLRYADNRPTSLVGTSRTHARRTLCRNEYEVQAIDVE